MTNQLSFESGLAGRLLFGIQLGGKRLFVFHQKVDLILQGLYLIVTGGVDLRLQIRDQVTDPVALRSETQPGANFLDEGGASFIRAGRLAFSNLTSIPGIEICLGHRGEVRYFVVHFGIGLNGGY